MCAEELTIDGLWKLHLYDSTKLEIPVRTLPDTVESNLKLIVVSVLIPTTAVTPIATGDGLWSSIAPPLALNRFLIPPTDSVETTSLFSFSL